MRAAEPGTLSPLALPLFALQLDEIKALHFPVCHTRCFPPCRQPRAGSAGRRLVCARLIKTNAQQRRAGRWGSLCNSDEFSTGPAPDGAGEPRQLPPRPPRTCFILPAIRGKGEQLFSARMLPVPLKAEPVLAAGPPDCLLAANKQQNRSKEPFSGSTLKTAGAAWWFEPLGLLG